MPYNQLTTTITSTTVPVSIIPPNDRVTWLIKPRAGSTNVLVWAYSGATPVAVPANTMELAASVAMSDADYQMSYLTDAMMQGWACVLESGGSATVDTIWK